MPAGLPASGPRKSTPKITGPCEKIHAHIEQPGESDELLDVHDGFSELVFRVGLLADPQISGSLRLGHPFFCAQLPDPPENILRIRQFFLFKLSSASAVCFQACTKMRPAECGRIRARPGRCGHESKFFRYFHTLLPVPLQLSAGIMSIGPPEQVLLCAGLRAEESLSVFLGFAPAGHVRRNDEPLRSCRSPHW